MWSDKRFLLHPGMSADALSRGRVGGVRGGQGERGSDDLDMYLLICNDECKRHAHLLQRHTFLMLQNLIETDAVVLQFLDVWVVSSIHLQNELADGLGEVLGGVIGGRLRRKGHRWGLPGGRLWRSDRPRRSGRRLGRKENLPGGR